MQAVTDCRPRDRARSLHKLAPVLDYETAVRAATLLNPLREFDLNSASALVRQMRDPHRSDLLSIVRIVVETVPNPLWKAEWIAEFSQGPERDQAIDTVEKEIVAAVDSPSDTTPSVDLIDAAIWLTEKRPASWQMAFQIIQRQQQQAVPSDLARLVEIGPDEAIIPCAVYLLDLKDSDERSDALATVAARLGDDDTDALLQRQWDGHALARLVPRLREPWRGTTATRIVNLLRTMEVSSSTAINLGPVLGRIAPYVMEADRADALRLLSDYAKCIPPVPFHEEAVRKTMGMIRIADPEGEVVEPDWNAGITRAELLTQLAAAADPAQQHSLLNEALRASLAVGAYGPTALLLADLASREEPELRKRLIGSALVQRS